MGKEIERKFLVNNNEWRDGKTAVHTLQGYLVSGSDSTIRVRVQGERAFLTIKGKPEGITRLEYEYEIPVADAEEILARLCTRPYIEKNRYKIVYGRTEWEIDEFLKDNEGLVVAEVELESEDQQIDLPPWIGAEVSHDERYSNANLSRSPYSRWGKTPV